MKLEDFFWTCPYRKYLGIKCFGCGAQTALSEVLKGNFAEAFKTYPAIYTLILLAIVFLLHFFTKKRKLQKLILPLIVINLVIIVASYYLR